MSWDKVHSCSLPFTVYSILLMLFVEGRVFVLWMNNCSIFFWDTTLWCWSPINPISLVLQFTIRPHFHSLSYYKHFQPRPDFVATMKYKPTKTELPRSLVSHEPTIRPPWFTLLVSGSKWSEKHLEALWVVSVDDICLNKLIPSRHIPHANKKCMFRLEHTVQ